MVHLFDEIICALTLPLKYLIIAHLHFQRLLNTRTNGAFSKCLAVHLKLNEMKWQKSLGVNFQFFESELELTDLYDA